MLPQPGEWGAGAGGADGEELPNFPLGLQENPHDPMAGANRTVRGTYY